MRSVTIVLVAAAIGSACSAQRRLTERDVVGRFVYHSEDPGDRRSDHEGHAIVLNADHTHGRFDQGRRAPNGPLEVRGQHAYESGWPRSLIGNPRLPGQTLVPTRDCPARH